MIRIGLVSDIHLGVGDDASVITELERVTYHFNEIFHPDHVVILGDLIEDATAAAEDRKNIRTVTSTLNRIEAPVTYLVGNHDVMHLSTAEFSELVGNDPWGSVERGDDHLVFLDSSAPQLPDARGMIDDSQLTFLERELIEHDGVLLFVHHPIHYHDIRDNYWFGEYPERAFCGNKREINERIFGRSVKAVFNGHLHETDHTRYEGIDHFTLNAFNKVRPDADVTGTYAELTVDGQQIKLVVRGTDVRERFSIITGD